MKKKKIEDAIAQVLQADAEAHAAWAHAEGKGKFKSEGQGKGKAKGKTTCKNLSIEDRKKKWAQLKSPTNCQSCGQ